MADDSVDFPVVVTGASSGIGLATVMVVAARGLPVVGLVPDPRAEQDLRDEAARRSLPVETRVADLSDPIARSGVVAALEPWALVNSGTAVADLLTSDRPPAHRRIGPRSRLLRLADSVVPDRVWDAAVGLLTRAAANDWTRRAAGAPGAPVAGEGGGRPSDRQGVSGPRGRTRAALWSGWSGP